MLPEHLVLLKFLQQCQILTNRATQAAMPTGETNQSNEWREHGSYGLRDRIRIHGRLMLLRLRLDWPRVYPNLCSHTGDSRPRGVNTRP